MSGFIYGEGKLAEATGVAPKLFQTARVEFLKKGAEWELVNNHVAYNLYGAALVLEAVLGKDADAAMKEGILEKALLETAPEPEKKEAPPIIGKVCRLFVNRCMLGVQLEKKAGAKEAEIVSVWVPKRDNFKKGMEVPLRLNGEGKYELARKLPRFPGRW